MPNINKSLQIQDELNAEPGINKQCCNKSRNSPAKIKKYAAKIKKYTEIIPENNETPSL
jgi:hypothetical protein